MFRIHSRPASAVVPRLGVRGGSGELRWADLGGATVPKVNDPVPKLTLRAHRTERHQPPVPVRPPRPVLRDREPPVSLHAACGAGDKTRLTLSSGRRSEHDEKSSNSTPASGSQGRTPIPFPLARMRAHARSIWSSVRVPPTASRRSGQGSRAGARRSRGRDATLRSLLRGHLRPQPRPLRRGATASGP